MSESHGVHAADDLVLSPLPEAEWNRIEYAGELAPLYRRIESEALRAYAWYMLEKRAKARVSKGLRMLSVILFAIGSVIPVISIIFEGRLNVQWGYVVLAAGAAMVALDRTFGFSSSWTRYLASAMAIRELLLDAQLRWSLLLAESGSVDFDLESWRTRANDFLVAFGSSVAVITSRETAEWAGELVAGNSELKASLLPPKPGAIAPRAD